jgi:hypothetical protein
MIASLETRVLNPVHSPNPLVTLTREEEMVCVMLPHLDQPQHREAMEMMYPRHEDGLNPWDQQETPLTDQALRRAMTMNKIRKEEMRCPVITTHMARLTSPPCTSPSCRCHLRAFTDIQWHPSETLPMGSFTCRVVSTDVYNLLTSECQEECRVMTSETLLACSVLSDRSPSKCEDALCVGQCRRVTFGCQHVGKNITPLTVLTAEYLSFRLGGNVLRAINPLPFEEWVTRYPLTRRLQIAEAREAVLLSGQLTRKDAKVKNMLKIETTTKMTDPRNISPRSDEFLSIMGPAISALEEAMHRRSPTDQSQIGVTSHPTTTADTQALLQAAGHRYAGDHLVKGLNNRERLAVVKQDLVGYGCYLETDYARFDRTISQPVLIQVQNFLFLVLLNVLDNPMIKEALQLALETYGKSDLGVLYFILGTRCSGDTWTSIGNGVINDFNTFVAMRHLPIDAWTSIHEGDDGVVAIVEEYRTCALAGMPVLEFLGFNVKLDVYNQLDDVSFCGRHFYTDGPEVYDHADLLRSLDKMHTTTSNMKDLPLLYAKACSYYYSDSNSPLLGAFCYAIISVLGDQLSFSAKKRALHTVRKDRWLTSDAVLRVDEKRPLGIITPASRVSCLRRAGIPIPAQLFYEASYLEMAHQGTLLQMPRIHREWNMRDDGLVWGDPRKWVREDTPTSS